LYRREASSISWQLPKKTRGCRNWVDHGDVADVLAAFAGWQDQVRSIVAAADETYKWALFDRTPTVAMVLRTGYAFGGFLPPDAAVHGQRDAEMASGVTDWSWAAIAWLYEHDAELVGER
jgi:hypothetical protein